MRAVDHDGIVCAAGAIGCTVLLLDERALTRGCLASYLEANRDDLRVVAVRGSDQLSRIVDQSATVDLAVISIGGNTAGSDGCTSVFERCRNLLPGVPIVVVADREDRAAVIEAIEQGAGAYVPTSLEPHILLHSLDFVRSGGSFVPASVLMNEPRQHDPPTSLRRPAAPITQLTPRELQVLDLLHEGKSNKLIAHQLSMQENTVKVHVRRIMKKLNAHSRTEAVFLAEQMNDRWQAEPPTAAADAGEAEPATDHRPGVLKRNGSDNRMA